MVVAAALVVAVSGLTVTPASAHTPHDDVSDVAFSPTFSEDGTVFVVAASRLFVSVPGATRWKPLVRGLPRAPEEEKSLNRIAIAPSDPDTMYVTSRVGGVFRSTDGGRSFEAAAIGLGSGDMTPIAVSPRSPRVAMTGGSISGFFRTVDGGARWSQVPGFSRVAGMGFVPASGRAVAGDDSGEVRVSDDDGASWTTVSPGRGAAVTAVAASAGSGASTVFVGDATGRLLRSTDGATSFAPIGRGLPRDSISSIAISPTFASDGTVWASLSERGVYRSTDAGRTWARSSRGLTTDEQAQRVNVAGFRTITAAKGADGTTLYLGGFDGLFRSDDGGDQWVESQTLVDFVTGLGVSPDFARDRTVAAATYVKGAYLSTNDGDDWTMIDDGLQQSPGEGNKFAPIRRLHNITFSPGYATDRTLFSAGWTAFLKSTDRGRSWSVIQVGPPPSQPLLRQYVLGVAPDYPTRHELYLGTRQGDIFRSEQAGDRDSWSKIGNAGSRVRSFVFDPSGESGSMFAGTAAGVMRSNDRGATWGRIGPAGETNLAISPAYEADGTVLAGTDDGLYVSRDRGQSWPRVALPAPGKVEALAVSPAFPTDRTVLASVAGAGLFRSIDGARTFESIAPSLLGANHVIADFTNPSGSPIQFSPAYATDRTIFGYSSQDVLRSTDGGDTWAVVALPSAEQFLQAWSRSGREGSRAAGSSDGSISTLGLGVIASAVLVFLVLAAFVVRRVRRRSDP